MTIIDLDAKRDERAGLVCAHCGRPDSQTNREHELYCDDCINDWLFAEAASHSSTES